MWARPGPVSYTHLDVYKRQVQEELAAEARTLHDRDHSFWASLRNTHIWILIAIFFCIVAGNSALVYYGPSICLLYTSRCV